MQPLRVTVRLGTPIARGAYPMLLDGLLAYAVVENEMSMADDENDPRLLSELAKALPFKKTAIGGHDIWCASAWMPVGRVDAAGKLCEDSVSGATEPRLLTRKSDVHAIAMHIESGLIHAKGIDPNNIAPKAGVLDTARGLFKNTSMTYGLKAVWALEAWCIGDRDLIEQYLATIEFIGAKRRLGHGRVESWDVSLDDRAEALWRLRPLPRDTTADSKTSGVPMPLPLCSPYWAPQNAVMQVAPAAIFW